jgi:predicted transcriptional regulator
MKEHVAEIVAAFVKRNQVAASELPGLIASVSQSLGSLGQAPAAAPAPPTPAVPIRSSVTAATITCLYCGKKAKMLKPHLTTVHNLTPDEYRTRWGLKPDYPVVARNYAARRSELAKSIGLGQRIGTRGRRTK